MDDVIFPIAMPGEVAWDNNGNEIQAKRFVSFRYEAVEDAAMKAATGRAVFRRVLMARIHIPGSRDFVDHQILIWPTEDAEEPRVLEPSLWEWMADTAEKWMSKAAADALGVPLSLLNLDSFQIASLRQIGVTTVEALSQIPDPALRGLENGRALRERARAYLAASNSAAPLVKAEAATAELRAENEELRNTVAELREAVAKLQAALVDGDGDDAPAAKRGRPRKIAA